MSGLTPSKIITPEHLAKANAALAKVQDAIAEAKLAVRAGIGEQSTVDNLQAAADKIRKFKSVYFPNT